MPSDPSPKKKIMEWVVQDVDSISEAEKENTEKALKPLERLAKQSKERNFPQLGLGPRKTRDLRADCGLRETNRGRSRSPEVGKSESSGYRIRQQSRGRLIVDCRDDDADEPAVQEDVDVGRPPPDAELVRDAFAGNFISYMCLARESLNSRGEKRTGPPDAKFGAASTSAAGLGAFNKQRKAELKRIQQKIINSES
ncbi:unnamed protein product [Amoebophrya sp. A120]|nr:unnamed protein product [Amoebophrya sp. A120]|eukprot:GSA120T00018880001.1